MEPQVETPQHFNEPLMHERFGPQHQDPIRPSAQEQAVHNEAGFDGFSKSHFVREHHACGMSVSHLLRDVKLVRNEINATAEESAHRRLAREVKQIKCAATKLKGCRGIKSSSKQTLLRPTQTDVVAQLCFG